MAGPVPGRPVHVIEMDGDPPDVARGQDLIDRFLAGRNERTLQAYSGDIEDFARFWDRPPAAAVARLLAGGPGDAHRAVLDYAIELRRQGRAPATVSRRLACLRALLRLAFDRGLIDWVLEVPNEEQVTAAMDRSSAAESGHYLFPRHPAEVDRLDVQHYALREAVGAHYLAPVEAPARVLDVGCGTGQWAFELCHRFPEALVVGLDLVAGKPEQPPAYRWVKSNLLQGLPFGDGTFDFVHQRLLLSGVPLASWPEVVADLVRVTRPAGWVELVELAWDVEGKGPATEGLLRLASEVSALLHLDSGRAVFDSVDDYLRAAGLGGVRRREVPVPIGPWGGSAGSLMITDLRSGFTRVCEAAQARSLVSAEEARALIQVGQHEWEAGRMAWIFALAWGRKPA